MGPAPYRDCRNFMVKLKYYISGTGQRDYARLTVGQEFVEVPISDIRITDNLIAAFGQWFVVANTE
jgi:hypothetical protein